MQLIKTIEPTAEPVHTDDLKTHLVVEHTDDDAYIAALGSTARQYVETFCQRQMVAATRALRLDCFWPGSLWLPYPPLLAVSSIQYVDENGDTQTLSTSYYDVDTYGLQGRVYLAYSQSWPTARLHENSVVVTYESGDLIPFTANADTDVLTWSGHSPTDGERIRLSNSGGALPAGLSANTDYYPIASSGATCQLSLTAGGLAVDITDAGTGTHFIGVPRDPMVHAIKMLVGHWYEHREAVTDGFTPTEVPLAVKNLMWSERVDL